MSIIIHGIKNCDTTKKARAWLDKRGSKCAIPDTIVIREDKT